MPEPSLRPSKPVAASPGHPAGTHHPTFTPDSDVHLLDRIAVLYRYRHVAIAVFVLASAAMMIQGYTSLQLFQAQAQIMIEDERATAVPGLNGSDTVYYEDPEPYYNTQYRILKGRDLTRRVIKKLDLPSVPEFNGTAEPPTTPTTIVNDVKQRVLSLVRPGKEPAEQETPRVDETPDESGLVSAFVGRVDVAPIRGSRLVNVSFTARDPKFAALAVNTLVDEYVEQNLQLKVQSSQNMLEWLRKELEKQQRKVQDSEQALSDYRDKQNALSLDDKQNIVTQRLTQLSDALTRTRTVKAQKEALYKQVREMSASTSPDAIPAIAQNPSIQALKNKIADLAQQRAQLAEKYGEKWPALQAVNANLLEARGQLDGETAKALQSIKNDYETAVLEERTLAGNLEAAKADAQDLSRKSVGYNVMEREARSNRQVYESLLARDKELSVASNSRANNVRVIDRAEVPRAPITPGGRRTWLVSLAVGLALAVAVAFGLDYMNDTIKTPEDVSRRLKLPFLGLVPSIRGEKHPVLTSSHVPHDFGEAFRSLRTSLIAKYPGDGTKIITVTSAQPLEGKTTTAANIAMALAYGGARVLLIDADMRRPGLHRPLRLTNERGLSQVLIGQARVRDVIQRTVDPNLLAITAGRTPPNPSELLASERMKTLLANLSHGPFDWIVVDTPPVLAVTDAVILAPQVSGVTFVVGAEMTRRRLAERAIETITSSHPKVCAVVLNKVDFARNKYYYSRYYGHQYKNYYAEVPV
ncbi:MAG TPA: polysaccharide biosynthesis tyrosine autokinase [Vicinamibacterales bacterium]|jgi:capsular exopolysaccharide synthesis family protein